MFLRFVYYMLLYTPSDYPVVDLLDKDNLINPYQLVHLITNFTVSPAQ